MSAVFIDTANQKITDLGVQAKQLLVVKGFELVQQMITRGNVSGAMRMPMYYVYLALPVSSLIMSLRLIGKLFVNVKLLFGRKGDAA